MRGMLLIAANRRASGSLGRRLAETRRLFAVITDLLTKQREGYHSGETGRKAMFAV
jgi:hypothetical protein